MSEKSLAQLLEDDAARALAAKQFEAAMRDKWATPSEVYEKICLWWGVRPLIDVAADASNAKCPVFITEEMDALKIDWLEFAREHDLPPRFWMNCPYSREIMIPFIETAIDVAERDPLAYTVFLLPAFVDQAWYHDLIEPFPHKFWRGRIKHIPPPGIKPSSPRNGSVHGVIRKP
ncbi:MAG: DNA N-6-adenine-methyltransferase [Ktedonobacteraceae bacterium]